MTLVVGKKLVRKNLYIYSFSYYSLGATEGLWQTGSSLHLVLQLSHESNFSSRMIHLKLLKSDKFNSTWPCSVTDGWAASRGCGRRRVNKRAAVALGDGQTRRGNDGGRPREEDQQQEARRRHARHERAVEEERKGLQPTCWEECIWRWAKDVWFQ